MVFERIVGSNYAVIRHKSTELINKKIPRARTSPGIIKANLTKLIGGSRVYDGKYFTHQIGRKTT